MAREFAHKFYHSREWCGVRDYVMKRDKYLCQCHRLKGGQPCGNAADEVHHIKWLTPDNIVDPSVALNAENLIALSRDCHMRIHDGQRLEAHAGKTEIGGEYEFDTDGNIVQRSKRVYLVTGCYGSGKTAYVKKHMSRGDLVVDMDYIFRALSLCDVHDAPEELLSIVMNLRDYLYKLIEARTGGWNQAWVISAMPNGYEREKLRAKLGAEPIEIDADKETCISRINADQSRPDKNVHRELAASYWAKYTPLKKVQA